MTNNYIGVQAFGEGAGATTADSLAVALSTSYTQITAATTFDWSGFYLTLQQANAATQSEQRCAIGIGSGGSEWDLLPDLLLQVGTNFFDQGYNLFVPLSVPAGSRLAGKSSSATGTVRCALQGVAMGSLPIPPCQFGTGYGGSGNTGTQVDPGTTANTKGSWVQITSSTSFHHKFLALTLNSGNNTALTNANFLIDIGVGAGGSETVLYENLSMIQGANEDRMNPAWFGFFPCDIPAGSRLAVRAQSTFTTNTDRLFNVTLIGLS